MNTDPAAAASPTGARPLPSAGRSFGLLVWCPAWESIGTYFYKTLCFRSKNFREFIEIIEIKSNEGIEAKGK